MKSQLYLIYSEVELELPQVYDGYYTVEKEKLGTLEPSIQARVIGELSEEDYLRLRQRGRRTKDINLGSKCIDQYSIFHNEEVILVEKTTNFYVFITKSRVYTIRVRKDKCKLDPVSKQ